MKRSTLLLSLTLAAPAAHANDFPTSSRVEYVLECMQKHESKYEYLYKCSCVIDQIAKTMTHEQYLEMSTSLRNQTMAGERGAVFRDPQPVKEMAGKYKTIQSDANKACYVPQR
jgi:lysyl-tRNA synthetase class II